jgi:hypothetical protein
MRASQASQAVRYLWLAEGRDAECKDLLLCYLGSCIVYLDPSGCVLLLDAIKCACC